MKPDAPAPAPPATVFACGTALDRLGAARPGEDATVVRLTCAGRLNAGMVLAAIESGADRVVVLGCDESSCRHENGPALAAGQACLARALLDLLGHDPARVTVELVDRAGSSRAASLEGTEPGAVA